MMVAGMATDRRAIAMNTVPSRSLRMPIVFEIPAYAGMTAQR
jgi:hypothetical protein